MADQKVSDLPALNGADVDSADLLYIVDSSAGTAGSKKITIGQYQLAPYSAATANTVVYFNGTKVPTSSSALTFDGTNLGIGTSSPAGKVDAVSNAYSAFVARASTSGVGQTVDALKAVDSGAINFANAAYSALAHIWKDQNLVEKMTLDASGNLGLGVTPSAWSVDACLEIEGGKAISFASNSGFINTNAYFNSGWKYITTSTAAQYQQDAGAHKWLTAASGTAGNAITFTEAMRLDASGNLLVGTTAAFVSSTNRLSVSGSRAAEFRATGGATSPVIDTWNTAASGDNVFVLFRQDAGGTGAGTIDYNRAGGLVRYNTTSDYRAKDILGPVANPGATIDALKVYEGLMKGATQPRPMLVAHEAQEHTPYAVSGVKDEVNEDGTPKFQQIDVSSLVPLLIAEIQSLRARVAALEAK